jgi:hypothetical protein
VEVFPEPNWVPTPGDRVEVIVEGAPACSDLDAVNEALNSFQANDEAGIAELIKSKRVERLAKGTKVLVLANSRPQKIAIRARIMDSSDFAREMQISALTPQPDFSKLPVEVRIMDGGLAGQKRYLPEIFMAKLVPNPNAPMRRTRPRLVQAPASKPESPKGARASTLLQLASNLEKSGKLDGATTFYRQIIKEFPDSAGAKTAAQPSGGRVVNNSFRTAL